MKSTEDREQEIIENMRGQGWLRPLDLGGHNGTHHSTTLARLVKRGVVERKQRSSHQMRPSYVYRLAHCPACEDKPICGCSDCAKLQENLREKPWDI